MATDATTATPTPSPAVNTPTAVDPLAGVVQPGAGAIQPGSVQDAAMVRQGAINSSEQETQAEVAANQRAAELANQSVAAPPPGPHARLFNMIEAIGVSMNAAGKALATRGQEGGASEVQDYYAKKQAQEIQAQQARMAMRDANVRSAMTSAALHNANAAAYLSLATLPQDLQERDIKFQAEQGNLTALQQENTKNAAEFAQQFGATPQKYQAIVNGETSVTPQDMQNFRAFNQRKVDAQAQILGASDPTVQQAQKVLADPKSSASDVVQAVGAVNQQYTLKNQVLGAQQKQVEVANASWKSIPGTPYFVNWTNGQVQSPAGNILTPDMMQSKFVQYQTALNQGKKLTPDQMAEFNAIKSYKTLVPQFNIQLANQMTDQALDQAAMKYLQTGEMPRMGFGAAGTVAVQKVMNRASELSQQYPNLYNLATNQASYKANQASLTNVTKALDTLEAFENTGLKNLQMFTGLASKIPDTGVPWINTPVRLLNEKAVGSANMAAVNAARAVALREIARVTNDPKLSGVLSDSARKEVEGLSPQNATFAQIKQVASILEQDMANVHSSLEQQKQFIAGRMSPTGNQINSPSPNVTGGVTQSKPSANPSTIPGLVIH
jgi:hypothetical protein